MAAVERKSGELVGKGSVGEEGLFGVLSGIAYGVTAPLVGAPFDLVKTKAKSISSPEIEFQGLHSCIRAVQQIKCLDQPMTGSRGRLVDASGEAAPQQGGPRRGQARLARAGPLTGLCLMLTRNF
jgi:hypothetical protein